MLFPQTNKSRNVISLDGLWKFRLLKQESDFTPDMILENDFEWIAVPASYNDQKEDPAYRRFAGLSVYQRKITLPALFASEHVVLRFDAVANQATVYLDGIKLFSHKGGYLPFEIELDGQLTAGDTAVLSVLVDNRVNHSTLPVGNEKGTAFFGSDNAGIPSVEQGKEYQEAINLPNFDFFNYAGINRPVRIYSTPKSYIRDITLLPDIAPDGTTGIVRYEIETFLQERASLPRTSGEENSMDSGTFSENSVIVEIKDAAGNPVGTATGREGSIEIPNACLWWPYPGTPYLYKACISFGNDYYEQTFGIRTVKVDGTRFLINGEPFYFKGFGKHEDFFVHGRGLNLCLDVKDAGLIHWLHANSFRTSHYPYAEEMYDLCDREGIIVIDETPAVGIGAGSEVNPYETFQIRSHHEDVIRDMIARDKNHPCIVMWSLGNEPDTEHFPESAYDYWHSLYELAHVCDPQNRPVTFVCCQNDYTKDIVTRTMDVVCLNRYYGWYNLSGDLDAAMYALNIELDFWEGIGKPLMFTEYGADTVAGMHASVPEMFSEEFQAEFLLAYGKAFDKRDFIIGEQMWNFADFSTIQGPMRADGNKKGLFTRDRKPKLSAHAMRHRWEQIPNFSYKTR